MDNSLSPALNYLTADNGCKIAFASSSQKGCGPENVLNDNDRQLWLSDIGLPQELIIDITTLKSRPGEMRGFGWYCWHGYSSNPSIVELYISSDGKDYIPWGSFHAQLKAGGCFYSIDPITREYKYIKIIINETFGASRTYINQLYLLADAPRMPISNPVSNTVSSFPSPRLKSEIETQESIKPNITTNPSVRFTDEVDSKDLKKKLSEQLQDLQENVSMMQVDRLIPAMPHLLPSYQSLTPKRPKSSLSMVSNKTEDIKTIKEEVKEWSGAINDMRENISILMKQVGALEQSMSLTNPLHTRESGYREDFSLKAKQGSTLSYPSLQIPSASLEDVFSALWEKKMNEWQENYLKPQLGSLMSRIEDKLDVMISRQNPKKVEDLVSKLQNKIYQRTKKIETLEKERYSRMSNRSTSPEWRNKVNTSSLY